MVCRKQNAPSRVHVETPHPPGHATGKSQLAWGIKKQKHMLADAVTLATRPQANPLGDGQVFARSDSANRVIDVEGYGHRFDNLCGCRRTTLDGCDRPGENGSSTASDYRQSRCARWSDGQAATEVRHRGLLYVPTQGDFNVRCKVDAARLPAQQYGHQKQNRNREQTRATSPKHGETSVCDVCSEGYRGNR